jgi:hypothetical protein
MICPLVGGVAMLYVVWTLWDNRAFAAGLAANSLVFQAGPYFILAVFVTGVVYAVWLRSAKPDVYREIGRTVMEDSHERSEETSALS